MQMKRTILLASLALAFTAQGQIVQSGFETWTNDLPDGWFGAKSSIAMSGVLQTTNFHSGEYAVQLVYNPSCYGHSEHHVHVQFLGSRYRPGTCWPI